MEDGGTSKWISEEVWRSALGAVRRELWNAEQPGFILYHHGVLDQTYTERYVKKVRHRYERIWRAGLSEWRERHPPEISP